MIASAGLHFVAFSRAGQHASGPPTLPRGEIQPAMSGTIDWRHADTPVPALFDLRFSADLTAIAAIPAPLMLPTPAADDPQ